MLRFPLHIDGVDQDGADWLPVADPAVGSPYAEVANASASEVDAAVRAAEAAAPPWAALKLSERARWLEKLANALEDEAEAFVAIESRDTGKPLALCRDIEIPRAIANLRFFAACAQTFGSESHHGEAGLNYTLRVPLGVVATISPWNLPLYLFTWKIAPALAAGNTVVAKPSEVTPASATALVQLASRIGLPKGVLNLIHGDGAVAGEQLVRHRGIKAVSFTGSTAVGRRIGAYCGEQLKKVSLELGGKNATLAFDDIDPIVAAPLVLRAAFQNAGQICLCGSRLLVPRTRLSEWEAALKAEIIHWRAGPPSEAAARLGPLVSKPHFDKVRSYLDVAAVDGSRIMARGPMTDASGWFLPATILTDLPENARCLTEEIFGPVLTLQSFRDDNEAIAIANSTPYGLAATVLTNDLARAHRLAAQLDVGLVWLNTWMSRDLRVPFGGSKQSGLGREGGWEAMRFFTEARNVCLAT